MASDKIPFEKKVLSENDRLAAQIRGQLSNKGVTAFNLVSSPGSGKTSLLEKTLGALSRKLNMALVAGDVQTNNDAERLQRAGGKTVRPIVTGGACHLDARMVHHALHRLPEWRNSDLFFIGGAAGSAARSVPDLLRF